MRRLAELRRRDALAARAQRGEQSMGLRRRSTDDEEAPKETPRRRGGSPLLLRNAAGAFVESTRTAPEKRGRPSFATAARLPQNAARAHGEWDCAEPTHIGPLDDDQFRLDESDMVFISCRDLSKLLGDRAPPPPPAAVRANL